MPTLRFVTHSFLPQSHEGSHITDLLLMSPAAGGVSVLYSTTRYDGIRSSWSLAQDGLRHTDIEVYAGADRAGAQAELSAVILSGTARLLSGGMSDGGGYVLHSLSSNGQFGASQTLGATSSLRGDLIDAEAVSLTNGDQVVFGGIAGGSGVGRLIISSNGNLQTADVISDRGNTHADRVMAVTQASLGGSTYVFTASTTDTGVTAWQVNGNGGLNARHSISPETGLWVATPTAMVTAQAGGVPYLVLAAAGTNSLTVMSLGPQGQMSVTDHVMDDRDSRFAEVSVLETVIYNGHSYLFSAGSDEGISVHRLLPDGTLLSVAHLADTVAMALSNISAIAVQASGAGIDVLVSSNREAGITRLLLDPESGGVTRLAASGGGTQTGTAQGDLLWGGAGNDRLVGGAGADVLYDGAGRDTLEGGSGADVFVMAWDSAPDTIADFTLGQDRIDLSRWPMLRSLEQLILAQTSNGFRITYLEETLTVISSTGRPIASGALVLSDILDLSRIPISLAAFAETVVGPEVDDTPRTLVGASTPDLLTGAEGGDLIQGMSGHDTLIGLGGNDTLQGGAGNDRLDGGMGDDVMDGGLGNDRYTVNSAGDVIVNEIGFSQGGGIDTVESWINFTLPANVEILRLMGDDNISGFGGFAPEALVGNASNNLLDGGGGNDVITAKAGDDTLIGGLGADSLIGDEGADVFKFNATSESRPGQVNRDFINGFVHGQDRIDLSEIDANTTRSGNQAFNFIGSAAFSGAAGEVRYFTFGGGNFNIVEADTNGDRLADIQIFINLTNWMTGSDFDL
jgi:Ca2+-binding RTX toxin-like protein